jgi:hypothetical protein
MNLHDIVVEMIRVLSDPLGLVNSKKRKNSFSGDYKMLTNKKLARLFENPDKNAWVIIEDQLEKMESTFELHLNNNDKQNALALYQEYKEWIDAPEGDTCTYLFMENLVKYD